ncbi:hypothetical protein [Thiorhodococcus minor]|uniref:Lipoprotein n=1 Tax=Thiorhodococcus minor TaxID=57489 RepID=A0A6M0JWS8_9GAMM|nr:hypothetical protein [Thiorhodococcus minor]NEV61960.1 hypothetical protein [Thiorhodococcus minor]
MTNTPTAAFLTITLASALALALGGCQTQGSSRTDRRTPAPGMTTSELASCGCFSASRQSRYAIGPAPDAPPQEVQSVSILSYFCPVEEGGMARVVVVNGIAKEVFE